MINTLQTLQDYQSTGLAHPEWSEDSIEDYQGLKADVNQLLELINSGELSPLSGTGSPEGLVYSNYSLLYVDTFPATPVIYFNPLFGELTGWVLT